MKMKTFEELGLSWKLLNVVRELNFESPTEIQEKTIPLILEGRDIVGGSATGSGKTLAFGLGFIEKINKGGGIQALILAPTRELADQVTKVFKFITKNYNLNICEIYGGVSISPQILKLRHAEIVVGTPGRILDHLKRHTLNLSHIKILGLDEADRMSDMGFLPDVEIIIKSCPVKRQTMLFSATISGETDYISKKYMKNPVHISVEAYVSPSKLQQYFYDVPRNMKFSILAHLLKNETSRLIMIFCNTRMNSDMLAGNLKRYGFDAQVIHGGLSQSRRNLLMHGFHKGKIKILVCTDVAARGLDIKEISHVYNYDIPNSFEGYIHRIGRTARAGKEGMAISIVTDRDYENFRKVLREESFKIEKKEIPEIEILTPRFERREHQGKDRFRRSFRNLGDEKEGYRKNRKGRGRREHRKVFQGRHFPGRKKFQNQSFSRRFFS